MADYYLVSGMFGILFLDRRTFQFFMILIAVLTINSRVLKNENIVLWYLLNGANPNIECGRDGKSPMTIAVKVAPLSTIRLLGSFGGSIHEADLITEVDYLSLDDMNDGSSEQWNIVARAEIIEYVLLRDWRH
jgi:hypothetical protein